MSGTFKLIANDGKADRLIMATKLLSQRAADITCARARAGEADTTPTLVDLERTHILYMNAHFKPFAAIGYEYNKVRPQSGNPSLGGGVTFSIPQFGDFFSDMVCRTRLSQFMGNQGDTPVQGTAAFPLPTETTWYNIVDAWGQVLVAGSSDLGTAPDPAAAADPVAKGNDSVKYRNFVRYCEYPGNRLFRLVKFDVNGNPLDQYDEMVPVMLHKFCTPPGKSVGHDRLVGQEVPLTGYGGLRCAGVSDADAANTPAGITKSAASQSNQTVGLFAKNATGLTAATAIGGTEGGAPVGTTVVGQAALTPLGQGSAQYDVSRQVLQMVNGPQTPKPVQPPLEIWNKLRFWFNEDVRSSIASVSIPFGMRFISIDLNQQNLLAFEYPSIFLEAVSDVAVLDPYGSDPVPQDGATKVRTRTYTPIFQKLGTTDITIEKMELYINNIFVNPDIHDIFIKRIGFSLIRVYRQHTQRCNQDSTDEKQLTQLKWPIEYMFVGLRPVWNIKDVTVGTGGVVTGGNQNQWRDWHRLTRLVDAQCDQHSLGEVADVETLKPTSQSSIGQVIPDQYYLPVPTVDSLTMTTHGIIVFDGFSDTFYNQYLPFHYGGHAIVTPDDPGALFVNMALFPRVYQPSGHLNISRARETFLKWTTSYVSARTPADLFAVAVAINFLLITDGSAVLRYST